MQSNVRCGSFSTETASSAARPLPLPPKADVRSLRKIGRDGPCVDGSKLARRIFTSQAWSVQPCVRPTSAVHMTAGHNALRGSGPGQKHAFDDAVARVGCPDRRNDRLCITCCSPSNRHITPDVRHDLVMPQARRVLCTAHLGPSWPTPSWRACWPGRSPRPSSDAALTAL